MSQTPIIQQIRSELQANTDQKTKDGAKHYFKETINVYGVKTDLVGKIARNYWKQAKHLSKKEVFALCEELFKSGVMEEAFVAANWLPNISDQFQREDLATFHFWIENYVDNWAKCDSFCNHTVGDFMMRFPDCVVELLGWARSGNRWLRRAAAVSLIVPAKKGMFLREVFEISDILLTSPDDLVQKGYGWLLKAETEKHPNEVLAYVIKNKAVMPRTALRYAIEKLPKDQKAKAMQKE
ncbi:MAG: DNA alkylation repair protein [Candidatus Bathyarchaeia archaeon]|jgi:3-methyladenine DNA glycosylase AlkD